MNISRTILFLCVTAGVAVATNDRSRYRLPEEVIPHSYAIKLQPILPQDNLKENGCLKGEVYIQVRVVSPVESINLHGSELNIIETKIVGDLDKLNFECDKDHERIRIYHENGKKILVGEYLLYFKYEGKLAHEDMMGMIIGGYTHKDEVEGLVVSDFQPTHARRAFPCFDEPALKAIFNVSIITPDSNWIALSNADEIGRQQTPEGVLFRFESTPLMSTEMTSLVVTKMGFLEKYYPRADGMLRIRTYLGNSKEENQTFVLDFAAECVEFYEEFTGINYPMSKIDFIEYDKKVAATEYWGLTTFKTGFLNPSLDIYDKHQISIVVAHELTHYWFGNLVTNKWWNELWLQEGFAQYFSLKAVDKILNVTINVDEFPFYYTPSVLHQDSHFKEIKPIVSNCTTPKDIMNKFNDITYIKAGSLLRMLDFLAGEEKFKQIIQKYVRTYSYSSASTANFTSVVDSVLPNIPVVDFFATWLYQNRFPIISIEEDVKNKVYILRQESASKFKDTDDSSPFGYRWTVPIIYTTDIQREPTTIWFQKEVDFITIPISNESFIKLNYNFMGIYFSNYTTPMWENLIKHAQLLTEFERAALTFEAELQFESDIVGCDIMLKLIKRIGTTPHRFGVSHCSPIVTLSSNLRKLDSNIPGILRKFYYASCTKSSLLRKRKEETTEFPGRNRRSLFRGEANSIQNFGSSISNDTKTKVTPPGYVKCAKWIQENAEYLLS